MQWFQGMSFVTRNHEDKFELTFDSLIQYRKESIETSITQTKDFNYYSATMKRDLIFDHKVKKLRQRKRKREKDNDVRIILHTPKCACY